MKELLLSSALAAISLCATKSAIKANLQVCLSPQGSFETSSYLTKLMAKVENEVEVGNPRKYYLLGGYRDHTHVHGHS